MSISTTGFSCRMTLVRIDGTRNDRRRRATPEARSRLRGALQRFLLRRVGNPQDADDLAQEVFARLLRVRDAVWSEIHGRIYWASRLTSFTNQDAPATRVADVYRRSPEMCSKPWRRRQRSHCERLELQDGSPSVSQAAADAGLLLLVKRDGHSTVRLLDSPDCRFND